MMQINHRGQAGRVLLLLVLALLALPSMAAEVDQSPQKLVTETTERIIEALRTEQPVIKKKPARLYQIVDKIVLPHFDFQRMASWVLGKYWRKASPAERKRFVREFRILLVRTYAAALNDNYDQKINFLPLRAKKGATEVTVRTEVEVNSGFPIPINYKMYRSNNGEWLVFDVSVDGVSLVTNYRSAFSRKIRKGGLSRLIASLAERNQQAQQAIHD